MDKKRKVEENKTPTYKPSIRSIIMNKIGISKVIAVTELRNSPKSSSPRKSAIGMKNFSTFSEVSSGKKIKKRLSHMDKINEEIEENDGFEYESSNSSKQPRKSYTTT
jgi:hypothetical protein